MRTSGSRIGAIAVAMGAATVYFTLGAVASGHASEPGTASDPSVATAAASPYTVLAGESLDAVGLAYVGTRDVSGPFGSTQVLRFTLTSGSLVGPSVANACGGNATTLTKSVSATLTGATLDVVRLAATVGGTPLVFTPDDPPVSPFPDEFVLTDITLSATTLTADAMTMSSPTTDVVAC